MALLATLLATPLGTRLGNLLGTDPGAGNIAVWICVILVVGGLILWVVTLLMLRGAGGDGAAEAGRDDGGPGPAASAPSQH